MKNAIKKWGKPITAILAAVVFFALGYLVGHETTETVKVTETATLTVSAVNDTIEVSEADTQTTRSQAYFANITIKLDGELVNTTPTATVENWVFFEGGQVSFTEEENGIVTVNVFYGEKTASTWFTTNEHKLLNDANGTTVYGSKSYGYMFDENGNQVNDGNIVNHDQDLDENGNTIGVQDSSKVVQSESFVPNSEPILGSTEGDVVVTVKGETILANSYTPSNNIAGGADMGNVEETVDQNETDPTATYRQIVIANANANGDGVTLNFVSTNGGEGTLAVVCMSIEGNVYHCVNASGEAIDLVMTVDGANVMFSGINGIYQ